MATIKTARRANDSKPDDCRCTKYEPFIYQESPFFCKEDKIVSADEVHAIIKDLTQRREVASKGFVPHVSLSYLESKSGDHIPISTVDRVFRQEINKFWTEQLSEKERREIINENYSLKMVATNMNTNSIEGGDGWPIDPSCWVFGVRDGGDCGCCSNYSGPC